MWAADPGGVQCLPVLWKAAEPATAIWSAATTVLSATAAIRASRWIEVCTLYPLVHQFVYRVHHFPGVDERPEPGEATNRQELPDYQCRWDHPFNSLRRNGLRFFRP